MSAAVIHVERLGKQYVLGRTYDRNRTLRESVVDVASELLRTVRARGPRAGSTDFWALRDVSFEIAAGEAVGLIGGNGAGKSTLLKLLSRITAPTTGRGEIRGRVGSLLEVGTGFHADLSGRENVYLNGAILGMRRREIDRKFDEIVEFAEVERFIDTPVKRYSSGMYLRLAFAVAAHLEPEVLLVDEVLAVGDAAFQRKCLGKMSDVAGEGRTVVFVSHNMDAIQRLCTRALLMESGTLAADGDSREITSLYLARSSPHTAPEEHIDLRGAQRRGTGDARFVEAHYRNPRGGATSHAVPDEPLEFELVIEARAPVTVESLAVIIYDGTGVKLLNADTVTLGETIPLDAGSNTVRVTLDAVHLLPGQYVVGLYMADSSSTPYDYIHRAFEIELLPSATPSLGRTPPRNGFVTCRFSAGRVR